ncbi:Oidioi.mRNA.OKI2018_I69.chr2.g7223.t2.cds [Oikopleura dioica]|uniref:Oidioi.mRNA.OKI2018_I69.chr2.g7223.t2.cds n=1 Tax=Oikopleura dioica TaxID=34765 RepID=A0ABN7T6G6_OIKDI|nr:Oidioi.mRNA.OKI2018_I69.chr2.g7223.t2.cds [Oikopleura dioica]
MGMGLPKHCYNVTVYESQMSVPVDESVLYIATVILLLMLLFSVVGNIITLMAITFGDRMQNKANCFIFSLAMSDLLSALVSPVGIYIRTFGFNPYRWPHPLCNVYWAIEESTSFTTSIHIASFAVFRYVSVCLSRAQTLSSSTVCSGPSLGDYLSHDIMDDFPHLRNLHFFKLSRREDGNVWRVLASVLVIGYSWRRYFKDDEDLSNGNLSNFLLPALSGPGLILLLHWQTTDTELEEIQKLAKESSSSCSTRLSCHFFLYRISAKYSLFSVIHFRSGQKTTEHGKKDGYHVDYWMNLLCYVCLRLSECMNPFLYNVASTKMRRSSHSRRVKNFDVRQSHSDPSIFSSVNDNRSLTPNDEPNKRPSSARHHLGLHETGSDDIPFSRTKDLQTHSKSCRARKSSRACENGYGSLMPAPTVLSNRTCHTLAPLHIHRGRSHCPNCQNNLVPSSSNESLN